jgi:hypothetical protein
VYATRIMICTSSRNIIPPSGRSFASEKQIPIDSTKKLIGISYKFAEKKPKVN